MKRNDFINAINLYGSDIEQWPSDIRDEARAARDGSAELRTLIDEERAFELSMNTLPMEEPDRDLAERIIMSAPARPYLGKKRDEREREPSYAQLLWMFLSPKPAVALVLTLVVGIVVGYSTPSVNDMNGEEDVVIAFLYHDEVLP